MTPAPPSGRGGSDVADAPASSFEQERAALQQAIADAWARVDAARERSAAPERDDASVAAARDALAELERAHRAELAAIAAAADAEVAAIRSESAARSATGPPGLAALARRVDDGRSEQPLRSRPPSSAGRGHAAR